MFMEAKNFSQSEIAEKLNVTGEVVSNWKTEKTQPDIDTLICSIFKFAHLRCYFVRRYKL